MKDTSYQEVISDIFSPDLISAGEKCTKNTSTLPSLARPPPGTVNIKPKETKTKKGHLLDIKSSWEHIRREAKLADVRIHDLRHTYASILINNGVSLSIVGKLLGHSNASTTERYAHLNNDTLRRATNIIKLNQL